MTDVDKNASIIAIAKQIEAQCGPARQRLNRDIFRDGAGYQSVALPWWRRARARVLDYFSTLWRALKGENPYDDEGW